MIAEGLLWYDDDPRRPFSAKMAEAAQRFSERTGWAPTACEANPLTLTERDLVPTTGRSARARAEREAEALAPRLVVTPNPSLRPNYILVGVEVGKARRPARKDRTTRASRAEVAQPVTASARKRGRAARGSVAEATRASA
ncbi:MAG TPA: hypothetical protein VF808_09620 [Ktedonobacterales bacterium]